MGDLNCVNTSNKNTKHNKLTDKTNTNVRQSNDDRLTHKRKSRKKTYDIMKKEATNTKYHIKLKKQKNVNNQVYK